MVLPQFDIGKQIEIGLQPKAYSEATTVIGTVPVSQSLLGVNCLWAAVELGEYLSMLHYGR